MKKLIPAAVVTSVALAGAFWPREVSTHNPVVTTVLFNREIATLFERKCLQCHAEDLMAMPLGTYAEARPWAVAIKEEILARRMPPWPAERGYGDFVNDIGLTTREFEFLISWIDGGVPKGEGTVPRYADHRDHWLLGDPDVVGTAREAASVAAGSPTGFRRIIIDPDFREDRWVRALDYKPTGKRVTRAAFFTIADTGQYVGGWTPWHSATTLPDGVAIRIPARSRIAVDVLYHGADKTVTDRPSLGLYLRKVPPASPMTNIVLQSEPARATPAAAGVRRMTAEVTLGAESSLLALRPEMGLGGTSIELKTRRPDGSVQVLLWIKDFPQEWQTPYIFRQPIVLPKGSVIRAIAYFDERNGPLQPGRGGSLDPPSGFKVTFTAYENRQG